MWNQAADPITTTAAFDVARTSGFDRLPPRGKDFWAVVWMNSVGGRQIFQFFERRAEIFSVAAAGEFEVTGRCSESDEGRKAIDDRTKTTLLRTQSFLSPLSVFNIGVHSAPFGDLPGYVG